MRSLRLSLLHASLAATVALSSTSAASAPAGLSPGQGRGIRSDLRGASGPFLQDAKLRGHGDAGVPEDYSEAGYSVAVSGDVALVGAWKGGAWTVPGLMRSGSACVFARSGDVWSAQQVLLPSDAPLENILPPPLPTFYFGYSVAVSGDTAVVGAPGHGAAYVFTRTGSTWTEEQKLAVPPTEASFFGSSVSVSGDTVVVGASGAQSPVPLEGAAFVFVRSGAVWSLQQKLTASDGEAGNSLGDSVALEGDTLVAGASYRYPSQTPGAAYVFVRAGAAWSEQQKLTASDGLSYNLFGHSVGLSGDTVIAGAESLGGPAPAAAYVFVRAGGSWSEEQKLVPSPGSPGIFGVTVSVTGDTAVVGAEGDAAGVGAAYVFLRSGGAWSAGQQLSPSDGSDGKNFGWSVSASGNTLIAGAPFDSPGGFPRAGSAYVFVSSGTTWSEEQKLVGGDIGDNDKAGSAVAVAGDTAVVGAPGDAQASGYGVGAAYVFVKSGTAWLEQQKLVASDGAASDGFGRAVAVAGDTVVVGAPRADTAAGVDAGSAYVFVRTSGTWSQQQKLTASDAALSAEFGTAVAVDGDTALVGAWYDNAPMTQPGSAYAFVRSGGTWSEEQKMPVPDGTPHDLLGAAVALSGDTALVGAPLAFQLGTPLAGAAYVFTRSGAAWSLEQKLEASDAANSAEFGWSVSLSGGTGVVGAPMSGPLAGAAYVFVRSGNVWSEEQRLADAGGAANDAFGSTVSVSGNRAVVGAPRKDTPAGMDAGRAYVFERSATTWTETQQLAPADPIASGGFAAAVSLSGETAVIGSPGFSSPFYPDSKAYVFRPHAADLSVSKTDGQATAVPGAELSYSIVVANAGPDDVAGVPVGDALPTALTQASWTCVASAGSSCAAEGSGGISDVVGLLVGGTATYTLTATVDPAAVGTLANTASASVPFPVTDPNSANDSAQDVDTLTPQADLQLAVDDLPDPAGAGGLLTYTVRVSNLGPSASTGMQLSDALPPELASIQTVPGAPACVVATGTVDCALAGLLPGNTRTVTIRGLVDAGALGTVISNAASVTGSENDPAAGNNSDVETTAVGTPAEADLDHGTILVADLAAAGGVPDEDLYRIGQHPYASYEVIVDGTSGDVGAGSGPSLERLASDATTVLQSSLPVGAGASRSLRFENDGAGLESGEYVRVLSAGCTSTCDAAAVYRIRAYETTLRSPRFNNGGSQITLLVLQNTGEAPAAGHVRLWDTSGALLASPAFGLAPRGSLVLNTSTVPGAAGMAGAITVSHDGPFGVLRGKAVAIEPATGFTFDTPLEARDR